MRYYLVFVLIFISTICNSQIINFPDANFKARLLVANASNGNACIGSSTDNCTSGVIDANANGEIEVSEAENVVKLFISGSNITDLTGIEYFTNLEHLDCAFNSNLTSINLSQLTSLKMLQCRNNQLTSLNLLGLNQLEEISCQNNQLTSLNISEQTQLKLLLCAGNQINSIDFSNNPLLERVYCGGNLLTNLDFSNNPAFFDLGCRNNPNLTTIKIKNGTTQLFGTQTYYNECWNNLPNLNYICADSNEITALQSFLAGCGVTQSIAIDSACPLSVNEYELASFVIAPNPSSDGLFTVLFDEKITNGTIEVYNLLGQKVAEDEFRNAKEYQLILSKATGTYILKINADTEQITKRLLIK